MTSYMRRHQPGKDRHIRQDSLVFKSSSPGTKGVVTQVQERINRGRKGISVEEMAVYDQDRPRQSR